jgi:CDP-glycerol glycerophosphotransferase
MARGFARRVLGGVATAASRLSPRSGRVWVFGNLKGFHDNPRYLAEHVVHAHPEIQAWWIARSRGEADAARRAGLSVAMLGTRRAARIQLRAGVAFLSNALVDLQPAYLGGALLVHLYHGLGLKRILLDLDVGRLVAGGRLTRAVARLQRWSVRRRLAQIDLVVAAGGFAQEHFATGFGLPLDRIPVLGSPRFDVIEGGEAYARLVSGDLRAELDIPADAHVVLWLPTWRERGDAHWLPLLDPKLLDTHLSGTKVLLLAKTHPYADHAVYAQRLPQHAQLRLLDTEVDVNCLLRLADALLTDYSSAAFDYALLHRPMHFFAPDAAEFDASRGLYEPFERLTGGLHHTEWGPVLRELAAAAGGDDAQGMAAARRVTDMARNNEEANVCERITRLVAERANVALAVPATRVASG